MSFTAFYRRAQQIMQSRFPSSQELGEAVDLEYLLSPHRLRLPKKIVERVSRAIKAHYQLANSPQLKAQLEVEQPWLKGITPRREAILMAYDFHTTESGEAYLVEVNTNASVYMLSLVMYEAHGTEANWKGKSCDQALFEAFQTEWRQSGRDGSPSVAIVDDEIQQQKMLVEFLMYRDWFKAHGWSAKLNEGSAFKFTDGKLVGDDDLKVDFVYNRLTDFSLEDERFAALREAYLAKSAVITPHPWAYSLLADKARLAELTKPGALESLGANEDQCAALRDVLIPTYELTELGTAEEIWAKRKNLFFKPTRSHGAKSVYRGSSVSRKVFERLMDEEVIAQKFVPAQAWPAGDVDGYLENWKFDVRFFVYGDEIQMAIARVYQGQVTNFSSRYGGLTAIDFV